MPKQTKSQQIGRAGERWFQQMLPSTWIFQPPVDDVGVDGVVVICEDNFLNGLEFRVQIKSSESWKIRGENVVYSGFNRKNLLYLVTGFTPTLLVLYEASNNRGVCDWLNSIVYNKLQLLSGSSSTVSLQVPLGREIISENWHHIGRELHGMNNKICKYTNASASTVPIMIFLNRALEILDDFEAIENVNKPNGNFTKDDEIILVNMDVSLHLDVILTLRNLQKNLEMTKIRVQGLDDFANNYFEVCNSFIGNFDMLVEDSSNISEIHVTRQQLEERRYRLTRSIFGAMRKITQFGLDVSDIVKHKDGKNE